METKDNNLTLTEEEQLQIEQFKETFAKLSPEIRLELLHTLPAYNMLISVHATTFEELALKRIAIQRGKDPTLVDFSYSDIIPACPQCGERKRISKDNSKTKAGKIRSASYFCNVCKENRHFSITKGSIVHQTQCDALTWMRMFYCLKEGFNVERSCKYCRIAKETYYNLRNRLFYAMKLVLDDPQCGVKLYGLIQCDNLYENVSYKGRDLKDDDTDDDDPERYATFLPRDAKERGGSYSHKDLNANSTCVFIAIDDHGHCATRMATIGHPDSYDLTTAIPASKYLLEIPEQDPFPYTKKKDKITDYTGPRSLLVSDGEKAIQKYATEIGIEHEYHVYHQNGVYFELPEGAHNIQRANWLCARLNAFFTKIGYVSTKYLPGFLTLFEFLHHCGTLTEALDRLFEILVTPGLSLGKTSDYAHQFKTPNYLLEWSKDGKLLKGIPHDELMATYLRHLMLTTDEQITYKDVQEATGIKSNKKINKIYNKMYSSGLVEIICEKMSNKSKPKKPKRKTIRQEDALEFYLYVYDEVCKNYLKPESKRLTTKEVYSQCLAKKSRKRSNRTFDNFMKKIENENLHPLKLSQLKPKRSRHNSRSTTQKAPGPIHASESDIRIFEYYITLEKQFVAENGYAPFKETLRTLVAQKENKSPGTVANIITKVKKSPEYKQLAIKHNLPYKEEK